MSLTQQELIVDSITIDTDPEVVEQAFKEHYEKVRNREQIRTLGEDGEKIQFEFFLKGFFYGCEIGGEAYMKHIQNKLNEKKEEHKNKASEKTEDTHSAENSAQ